MCVLFKLYVPLDLDDVEIGLTGIFCSSRKYFLCANDWNKKLPYIRHASFRFDLVPDLFMQANSVMHI